MLMIAGSGSAKNSPECLTRKSIFGKKRDRSDAAYAKKVEG